MSAVEAQKAAEVPTVGTVQPVSAPIEPVHIDKFVTPVGDAPVTEEAKVDGETVVPVEEKKEDKIEEKVVEPIYSGTLGYKAPGLKNAFRFAKKHFWFGDEPVPSSNLREYLRGEKPEVAHGVAAWSSQTGKGLLYFVKHVDQKEHPAGALNLAYATDLHKDGALAFAFKISGSKHTFEAQNAAERNGWFMAVEKAITEAKGAKDGIESSDGYKEQKELISKPTALAAATASTAPKKSTDATPKLAETDAAVAPAVVPIGDEAVVAAPARAGSSSSSSSDEEKKAKKNKTKSRSASRKRASIFGGLLGKKDKAEEKKEEHKVEGESSKTNPEVVKEEAPIVPVTDISATAPVITQEIPHTGEELKSETAPAVIAPAPIDESKVDDSKVVGEKPKPTKRASIFGSFFEKVKSPTYEKKEGELIPAVPAKDSEVVPEATKPLEEAQVTVPVVEPVTEPTTLKTDEVKSAEKSGVHTPSKEKEHFSFGKFFGGKDRAKSPAPAEKVTEPSKVDAVAPKIEDTTAPVVSEPVEPVAVAPIAETTTEPTAAQDKKEKRTSIFGSLGRSLSKATKSKDPKDAKKETATPATVHEEDKTVTPLLDDKKDGANATGEVIPEAVTVGEAPKGTSTVPTTA